MLGRQWIDDNSVTFIITFIIIFVLKEGGIKCWFKNNMSTETSLAVFQFQDLSQLWIWELTHEFGCWFQLVCSSPTCRASWNVLGLADMLKLCVVWQETACTYNQSGLNYRNVVLRYCLQREREEERESVWEREHAYNQNVIKSIYNIGRPIWHEKTDRQWQQKYTVHNCSPNLNLVTP